MAEPKDFVFYDEIQMKSPFTSCPLGPCPRPLGWSTRIVSGRNSINWAADNVSLPFPHPLIYPPRRTKDEGLAASHSPSSSRRRSRPSPWPFAEFPSCFATNIEDSFFSLTFPSAASNVQRPPLANTSAVHWSCLCGFFAQLNPQSEATFPAETL